MGYTYHSKGAVMDLSIIIVNYNTYELTCNTIQSVTNTLLDMVDYEIILIDNGSSSDVKTKLSAFCHSYSSKINLIFNSTNLGFSAANNIGIKASSGNTLLLLNSDTIVQPNCIQNCLNYLSKNKDIGALGCKLLLSDGTLDHACKRGFPTPEASLYYFLKLHKLFPNSSRFTKYTLGTQDVNQVNEVDSLTGAFMMLPRTTIVHTGMFDEDFFMYGEDLDWCYRIKEEGYKIIYFPYGETIHLKGQSSKKKKLKTTYEFYRAMILFYNKHYKKQYPFFISAIMYLAISIKMLLSILINYFK